MARIDLPFQPRWRPRVLDGTKTTTVRTRRVGAPGDVFEVEGATFALVRVDGMTLADARDAAWRTEGMDSPRAFEAAWIENHPTRGFRPGDQVFVHTFARVP